MTGPAKQIMHLGVLMCHLEIISHHGMDREVDMCCVCQLRNAETGGIHDRERLRRAQDDALYLVTQADQTDTGFRVRVLFCISL